jgi:hypothetical protein
MARPRGFIPNYAPRSSAGLLEQVQQVLVEYQDQLPLTCRQVFYRLVGAYGYEKTELAYKRLLELLGKARRGRLIPMSAIRDDGPQVVAPQLWRSGDEWLEAVRYGAKHLRLTPWDDQPIYLEVICEAGGMVPMLAQVADPYGVTVRSGGGFDSISAKHDLAVHYAKQGKPVVVLHVGDYDPSGEALWLNLSEDVGAFCSAMGGAMTVRRIAVTPHHQQAYGLPTAPPKRSDKRGCFTDSFTVQAEALPPDVLQALVRDAISAELDHSTLQTTERLQEQVREQLSQQLQGVAA